MAVLRKLLRLSPGEVASLCQTSLLLLIAELSLRLWSVPTILHAIERRSARAPRACAAVPTSTALARLIPLVERADHHSLLRPSCLRQALVLAWLLGRRGVAASLRFGVATEHGRLQAHAWLDLPGANALRVFADPRYTAL